MSPISKKIWATIIICVVAAGSFALAYYLLWYPTPSPLNIKIGTAGTAEYPTFLPLWIGLEYGYFKEQGLNVTVLSFTAAPQAMRGVIAGDVDFAICTTDQVAKTREAGLPTVSVFLFQDAIPFNLILRNDLVAPEGAVRPGHIEDLAGLTFGTTSRGSSLELYLRFLLVRSGIDPDKDVTITPVGGLAAVIAALETNAIDGIVGWEPLTTIMVSERKTHKIIYEFLGDEDFDPFLQISLVTLTWYTNEHPDVTRKTCAAFAKATEHISERKEDALKMGVEMLEETLSEELARESTGRHLAVMTKDGVHTHEGVSNFNKVLLATGTTTRSYEFEELCTNEFLPKP